MSIDQQLLDLYRQGSPWTPDEAAHALDLDVHEVRMAVARLYLARLITGEMRPDNSLAFRYAPENTGPTFFTGMRGPTMEEAMAPLPGEEP